jgi:hypothetical protein
VDEWASGVQGQPDMPTTSAPPRSSAVRTAGTAAALLCSLLVGSVGCQPASASIDVAPAPAEPRTAAASTASAAPSSPLGRLDAPTPGTRELRGVVAERLKAGSYSYLRIEGEDGSHWVATTGAGAEIGERVVVRSMGTRRDFNSPRLGRHFDELVFGFVDGSSHERTTTEKS